jgi:hypothetical protein
VPDATDACAGTPAGDLVDATGCSVCPCGGRRDGGSWGSGAAYVRCVRAEARRRLTLGLMARAERRRAVRAARQSSCGRSAATRCCLYAGADDDTGQCRVLAAATCAAHEAAGDADDLGPGTCLPSPCAR